MAMAGRIGFCRVKRIAGTHLSPPLAADALAPTAGIAGTIIDVMTKTRAGLTVATGHVDVRSNASAGTAGSADRMADARFRFPVTDFCQPLTANTTTGATRRAFATVVICCVTRTRRRTTITNFV